MSFALWCGCVGVCVCVCVAQLDDCFFCDFVCGVVTVSCICPLLLLLLLLLSVAADTQYSLRESSLTEISRQDATVPFDIDEFDELGIVVSTFSSI